VEAKTVNPRLEIRKKEQVMPIDWLRECRGTGGEPGSPSSSSDPAKM
jgi:hypothetical protein